MVVNIDPNLAQHERPSGSARLHRRKAPSPRVVRPDQCVTIGLLNNMAGAAFKATERQFVSLLDAASARVPIRVSYFTLPGLSQNESGGEHFSAHYADVDSLWDTHLDGLIVTGREPKMASLRDEPYWESFTQVLEWARRNTHSTAWSCLAAHAAILHMDGISRRKSAEKNFGVFDCEQVAESALMKGLASHFHVPHSRWNGIATQDLEENGYDILSRVVGNGVDAFAKQEKSLFVFFQGHLEYETDTLLREFRRDVGRYIKGDAPSFPLLPSGYFDAQTEIALRALAAQGEFRRNTALLSSVATVLEQATIENTWRRSAVSIYRNWLQGIRTKKSEHGRKRHAISPLVRAQ